jgi:hypothetical protein
VAAATAGTANTGGGGGGGGGPNLLSGADGGSGVVIVRYMGDTNVLSGGTGTSYVDGGNTYWVHTFNTSGDLVVVPEPTQMVFVAGVTAALGMWRMRKLRRNSRGSNATAC